MLPYISVSHIYIYLIVYISNHHVVHFQYIHSHLLIIPHKVGKNKYEKEENDATTQERLETGKEKNREEKTKHGREGQDNLYLPFIPEAGSSSCLPSYLSNKLSFLCHLECVLVTCYEKVLIHLPLIYL